MNPSSLLLAEALDTPMGSVAVLDEEGRVIFVNRAFERFFSPNGATDSDGFVGERFVDILHEGGFETGSIEQTLPAVIGGERDVFREECPMGNRWFLVKGSRFTHDGDVFLSAVVSDITERKEVEAELRETVERLHYVTQMLSHDLKSPLNVAQGYAEMLEDAADGSTEYLGRVQAALDRMNRLIDNTVAIATSQVDAETEAVSLRLAARDSWEMSPTKEATLTVTETTTLSADPNLLSHLLNNLFKNAAEHGGDNVTVRVGALPDGFYVEDDGVGFPESVKSDLERVFEQGFTTNTGGTGVGLAIVSYMADLHGWSITATESVDGGARFEIHGVELADEE